MTLLGRLFKLMLVVAFVDAVVVAVAATVVFRFEFIMSGAEVAATEAPTTHGSDPGCGPGAGGICCCGLNRCCPLFQREFGLGLP